MKNIFQNENSCFKLHLLNKDINTYSKNKNLLSRAGFTLIEIIAVAAVIAILAAAAIPSMIGFIEHGKQVNRTNIARTIYLAAQNQLTKSVNEKNLKSMITGYYYNDNGEPDITKTANNNVEKKLMFNFPSEDMGNKNYVCYVSKPKGYVPPLNPTDNEKELYGIYKLLDEIIIDKTILEGAILIEYNIVTGVVLSVFYGDTLNDGEKFEYLEERIAADNNVTGLRGVNNGYQYASVRKQGYYGVESTGTLPSVNFDDIINIYDGKNKPLVYKGARKENVLYVELLLPKKSGAEKAEIDVYNIDIVNGTNNIISYHVNINENGFPSDISSAINNIRINPNNEAIYQDTENDIRVEQYGIDVGAYYNRYIWLIDFIEGDILADQPCNINRYKDSEGNPLKPQDVRARASRDGNLWTTSISSANTHFNGVMSGGSFEIKSARHLNNIRYVPSGNFRQTSDINLMLFENEITNFAPVENFSGKYYAMKTSSTQYVISNLIINTTGVPNVGLFAEVSGENSIIQGVSLYNAMINAVNAENAGAVAGILNGGIIKQCNSYANITVSNAGETANAGGLVGYIEKGILDQCFNAGFYNTNEKRNDGTYKTKTSEGQGFVISDAGNIGGLAGLNLGTIQNSFNNARINISDVSLSNNSGMLSHTPVFTDINESSCIGGIAGKNRGTVKNSYATNFVAVYFNGESGGITGNNDGGNLSGNFYISNGCSDYGAVSGNEMRGKLHGTFSSYIIGGNYDINDKSYNRYPYPTLKNNNPFKEGYNWGWEDISGIDIEAATLLYYEKYNDASYGYSRGGFPELAKAGEKTAGGEDKLVVNDGYLLEFVHVPEVKIIINSNIYILKDLNNDGGNPNWVWESSNPNPQMNNIPLYYKTVTEGAESKTVFRLFFENSVLEAIASESVDGFIDFQAEVLLNIIVSVRFNPYYADTIDGANAGFVVRSPRHFDNIDRNLSNNFVQDINMDFNIYRKELMSTEANAGVVTGIFNGVYDGQDLYIQNVTAQNGIFAAAGSNAEIGNIILKNSSISGEGNVGGIAGENSGIVDGCSIAMSDILGSNDNVGGIAGNNNGIISNCKINSSNIFNTAGGSNTGGIAGNNSNLIENCSIVLSSISGNHNNIGGIAGNNTNIISKSYASQSNISSTNGNNAGGISGRNTGRVEDVFFLSVNDLDDIPVKSAYANGGIVGNNGNTGIVTKALYFAPAPQTITETKVTIYPIVGSGNESERNGLYETCFYLSGYRYSLDEGENWNNNNYNYINEISQSSNDITSFGGGTAVITKFFDKEWLNHAYHVNLSDWFQPVNGYPYPMIKDMPSPVNWPVADSPVRPDQLDTNDWAAMQPISEGAEPLGFVNGSFSDLFIRQEGINVPVGGSSGGYTDNTWDTVDMDHINGWWTRPISSKYDYFDLSNFSSHFHNVNTDGYYYYGPEKWKLIEFQEPNGKFDFMPTNYKGQYRSRNNANVVNSPYRYAELNAQLEGTLYQVCPTTPGVEFYYSFYHSTNNYPKADSMNFYLSPIDDDEVTVVRNAQDAAKRDEKLTLIRPCSSPRSQSTPTYTTNTSLPGLTNRILNPAAWNTVIYDPRSGDFSGFNLSYHNGKSYMQPDGTMSMQNIPETGNIYLYDVWVGDTVTAAEDGGKRSGYGITFWSTSILTIGNISNSSIPSSGISWDLYENNSYAWLTAAKNNVIGYWGVEYGWKHYYGLYTVPEDQKRTEFAFRSKTNNPEYGNYLDGVSFKSPAFLSINKYIKDSDGNELKFVKPGDILNVELHVENTGEIPAENINIIDRLTPFDEYIEYIPGSAKLNGNEIDSTSYDDGTVLVKLDSSTRLKMNETLIVTFEIKVRDKVASNNITETLLYYFKNQAVIEYNEDGITNENKFDAYKNRIKLNASGPEPVEVFIDPIRLAKTAETAGTDGSVPVNGPFNVTLTIENTTKSTITTNGIINDIIPKDFSLDSPVFCSINGGEKQLINVIQVKNSDGSTRITIRDVNLGMDANLGIDINRIDFTYMLKYSGDGYGVSYISTTADYKYLYRDEFTQEPLSVLLKIPKPVVGIKIKTQYDNFIVNGNATHVFDFIANDNLNKKLSDSNYQVLPEVVLTDSNGNPVSKNGEENYYVENEYYTAVLAKGTNNLEFTAKPAANGVYELYYKVILNAKKPGGTPEHFNLTSDVTKITIYIMNDDSLVYYEKYENGEYGFYAGENIAVPRTLDDMEKITESGYGVLSASPDKRIHIEIDTAAGIGENYKGIFLYKISTDSVNDFNLKTIKFGTAENIIDLGKIYPNFAKAVYTGSVTEAGGPFYIRTAKQMLDIALIESHDKTFIQERDIDFTGIDLDENGAVVNSVFKGTFDGNNKEICNVIINFTGNNAGLFSQNAGTIKNIILKPGTSIKGYDNVGGIAGHNFNGGIIENCTVTGFEDAGNPGVYFGMHIEGNDYIGGIAGRNNGTIINCAILNTTKTIKGNNYVGGIAGINDTTGIIFGAAAENIRINSTKENYGMIFGRNMNNNKDSVSGTVKNVLLPEIDRDNVFEPGGINNLFGFNDGEVIYILLITATMIFLNLLLFLILKKHKKNKKRDDIKDRILKILKDKSGSSFIFVLGIMLLLMSVGVSILVAASANTGFVLSQKEHSQILILDESIHKNIMYNLQSNEQGDNFLSAQIVKALYEARNNERASSTSSSETIPDIPFEMEIDGESLSSGNISVRSITLSFPKTLEEMVFIKDPIPAVYPGDSEMPYVPEVVREPKTAMVNAVMIVTVEIAVKESSAESAANEKTVTSRAIFEYTGGILSDDPDPANLKYSGIDDPGASFDMDFTPGGYGEWRLIKHEKVDS